MSGATAQAERPTLTRGASRAPASLPIDERACVRAISNAARLSHDPCECPIVRELLSIDPSAQTETVTRPAVTCPPYTWQLQDGLVRMPRLTITLQVLATQLGSKLSVPASAHQLTDGDKVLDLGADERAQGSPGRGRGRGTPGTTNVSERSTDAGRRLAAAAQRACSSVSFRQNAIRLGPWDPWRALDPCVPEPGGMPIFQKP